MSRNFGLPSEVVPRLAVHFRRADVDLALRVDEEMDRAARRAPVDDLEAGELDDPVALQRIEAGGFGVEDDLAHRFRTSDRQLSEIPADTR